MCNLPGVGGRHAGGRCAQRLFASSRRMLLRSRVDSMILAGLDRLIELHQGDDWRQDAFFGQDPHIAPGQADQ